MSAMSHKDLSESVLGEGRVYVREGDGNSWQLRRDKSGGTKAWSHQKAKECT